MNSLAGHLLLALPALDDPNFRQTVTLMIEHNEESAMGLVLNRPSGTTLSEAWSHVAESPCPLHAVLHVGGPCEGPLMVLHSDAHHSDRPVTDSIHFSVAETSLNSIVAEPPMHARFFVGYAGWGPGQLENELRHGAWLATPATPELAFDESDTLWRKLIAEAYEQLSPKWRPPIMPDDPSLN